MFVHESYLSLFDIDEPIARPISLRGNTLLHRSLRECDTIYRFTGLFGFTCNISSFKRSCYNSVQKKTIVVSEINSVCRENGRNCIAFVTTTSNRRLFLTINKTKTKTEKRNYCITRGRIFLYIFIANILYIRIRTIHAAELPLGGIISR